MLKGLEVDVVAPWAKDFFDAYDKELTERDVDKMKETLEYDKIILSKPSTYDDIERELSSKEKVPLSLIAFDVLKDKEYINEDCFFYMEKLDDSPYPVIFSVSNKKIQAFQLAPGVVFKTGTVIRALKKK